MTYVVIVAPRASRALAEQLPEKVAAACWEFIHGPLAEDPHRVGERMRAPLDELWTARRGEYRVLYAIHDERITVEVVRIAHRRDAYRR